MLEKSNGIPIPERCFCSPLYRALDTWKYTYGEGDILDANHQKVMILEVS